MVKCFCLVSLTLSNRMDSLWILLQSDTVNDLIFFVDHCDLYFTVQCFCLVSPTLSNRRASLWILVQSDAVQ